MKTTNINIRVEKDIKKQLVKAAKLERKSLGQFMIECSLAGAARDAVFRLKEKRT